MSNVENVQFVDGLPLGEGVEYAVARRLGFMRSESFGDWYIAFSPRNGYGALAEGTWEEWVDMARQILAIEERRIEEGHRVPDPTTEEKANG